MRQSAQFNAAASETNLSSASANFEITPSAITGGADENELKQQLFSSMKSAGVLNGLKSQLRAKLYDQLRLKNERVDVNLKDT